MVSTQVLQEYYDVITRKLKLPQAEGRRQVEHYALMDVVEVRVPLIFAAIDLQGRHKLSIWDALIIKAAAAGGCSVIYSKDMQHGQVIDGVRVQNPFAARSHRGH